MNQKTIQIRIQIQMQIWSKIQIQIEFGPNVEELHHDWAKWVFSPPLSMKTSIDLLNGDCKNENSSANSYSSANTNLLENFD